MNKLPAINNKEYTLYGLYYYINMKLSISEICDIYGCSYSLIIKKIKEFDLKREHVKKIYFFNIEEIKILLNKGFKQIDIAKMYNCDKRIINKFLKKHMHE